MATYNQGIHGRFSGRVGNVVGSSWKGRGVMRIRPASVSNPKTGKQLNQRSRFGMAVKLVHANGELVKPGFGPLANGMSAYNAAVSYNLAHAFTGEYPDVSIDYAQVMLSKGELAPVSNLTPVFTAPNLLTLNWDNNSTTLHARTDDRLMVSLYDAESGIAGIYPLAAAREDGSAELQTPEGWNGRNVQVFAFFLALAAIGGNTTKTQVSDTAWGGTVLLG